MTTSTTPHRSRLRGRLRGRLAPVWVLSLGGALLLAGCSGPGSATSPTDAAFDCADAAAAADTASTLTVFTGAGTESFTQGLADAFMKKYPKITVKLQVEADNNYNTVLPRLLASDTPPDLAAPADLIGSVDDGLVANLDSCATTFGWEDKIPATVLAAGRVDDSVIGTGSLYAAGGAAGPLVGVFYNRALAEQVGMTEVPTTIAELEAVMKTAKADGITPIVASNSDGLTGHLFNLLLSTYMGPQKMLDVIWHAPGATLDTPEAKSAATVMEDWAKAGYFNEDANAINQDASYGEFAAGKGLFLISGTWVTQALPASFDGQYGILPFPAEAADGQQVSMTGNQLALSIASHSKNKAAAALYLDFLGGPEAAAVAAANGYPSAIGDADATPVSLDQDVTDQIQSGYAQIGKANGFTSWLNNATPEVNTEMTVQLQKLLALQTSGDAAIDALEATYTSSLAQ